ncbi:MAG: PAS domain S-box protein [Nitrospiraceae bacterium]|nr:PAS domain S-box protein [Nitrospiraceae bacterium]
MSDTGDDVKALADAFIQFTRSTQALEESHRLLQGQAKRLSEELAAKNRELALTNDYLNYILESMSDGVIAIGTDGLVTKFNRSAGETLGYTAAEVVGRPFDHVFGREFTIPSDSAAMELRAKSGRSIPVTERDAPMSDRNQVRIGYVKVFQDLTELEALRAQVRQMDRLAALGEMAATVAHEIRNPLGGIRGFAALLARDVPATDPRSRLVEKILVGTKSLDRVVNELLEYTKPVDLELRPVACAELANAAIAYLELKDQPIKVSHDISADLCVVADPGKMSQVLLNILINAVQSIEAEGTVSLSATADARTVTVTVRDTGCGMTQEELDHAFSPFFSTKEKGTGLGLAVAAKIVEGHGGSIQAESEPDRGSTFSIRLPRMD